MCMILHDKVHELVGGQSMGSVRGCMVLLRARPLWTCKRKEKPHTVMRHLSEYWGKQGDIRGGMLVECIDWRYACTCVYAVGERVSAGEGLLRKDEEGGWKYELICIEGHESARDL